VKRAAAFALASLALSAAAFADPPTTSVADRSALERLLGNTGMSIQWISWAGAERGEVKTSWRGKALYLEGSQSAPDGVGEVTLNGQVVRISKSEFILNGTIRIENTPDAGRTCKRTGDWRFAITQNRKYWRLREFEWCDDLTDYIDIYF
jgi:hypothetical protein